MTPEEQQEKIIDYLYGEMSSSKKLQFQQELENSPHLQEELASLIQLRQISQTHLPQQKAPQHLSNKVLAGLGIRRPWYELITQEIFRPALAGAMVLVLTLSLAYQMGKWRSSSEVAQVEETHSAGFSDPESEAEMEDKLLVSGSAQPSLRLPLRKFYPGLNGRNRGLISPVGVGDPSYLSHPKVPSAQINYLEIEAERSIAQFTHQQALRMYSRRDYVGAAEHLAKLIKDYPFYPLKVQAMAQRIDSLLKAGDPVTAKEELRVLKTLSPNLASIVKRRWKL